MPFSPLPHFSISLRFNFVLHTWVPHFSINLLLTCSTGVLVGRVSTSLKGLDALSQGDVFSQWSLLNLCFFIVFYCSMMMP